MGIPGACLLIHLPTERAYSEIGKIIHDGLELAMANFRESSARFNHVMKDVPSGIPHPDGSLRIKQASEDRRKALAELQSAVNRHNKFFTHGIVPDDLKDD